MKLTKSALIVVLVLLVLILSGCSSSSPSIGEKVCNAKNETYVNLITSGNLNDGTTNYLIDCIDYAGSLKRYDYDLKEGTITGVGE